MNAYAASSKKMRPKIAQSPTCLLNCLPGPRGIIEEEEEVFVFVDVVEVLGIAGTHTRARV